MKILGHTTTGGVIIELPQGRIAAFQELERAALAYAGQLELSEAAELPPAVSASARIIHGEPLRLTGVALLPVTEARRKGGRPAKVAKPEKKNRRVRA